MTAVKKPKWRKKTPKQQKTAGAIDKITFVLMLAANWLDRSRRKGNLAKLPSMSTIWATSVAIVVAPRKEIETLAF